jgi:hypothetical protein
MEPRQARMLTVGATLLALMLMPVAWYAVAIVFLSAGRLLGGGDAGTIETLVRVSWFVAPPVAGFIALWATGSLVRHAPLWRVFVAFSACVSAMFVMSLLALVLGAWAAEWTLIGGMFAEFALLIGGAWLGRRVAEGGRA